MFPFELGGEIILIFFAHNEAMYDSDVNVVLEWSNRTIQEPTQSGDCPRAPFDIPELYGTLYRANEYLFFPEDVSRYDSFPKPLEGRTNWSPLSEATLIGMEARWLQHNPYLEQRSLGRESRYASSKLLATLASFDPYGSWPFPDQQAPLATGRGNQWFDGDRIHASGGPIMYIQSYNGDDLHQDTQAS